MRKLTSSDRNAVCITIQMDILEIVYRHLKSFWEGKDMDIFDRYISTYKPILTQVFLRQLARNEPGTGVNLDMIKYICDKYSDFRQEHVKCLLKWGRVDLAKELWVDEWFSNDPDQGYSPFDLLIDCQKNLDEESIDYLVSKGGNLECALEYMLSDMPVITDEFLQKIYGRPMKLVVVPNDKI